MHLGFLTPEFPHPRTAPAAGLGTSIKHMADALVSEGVTVSIFVYGQKESLVFSEKGIKIHLISQQNFRFLGWYLHRKFLQNYLNKYILIDQIDAIEAPDWTGITAFLKLKCPLVIRMNGSDTYFCHLEGRPQKKKNYWFEKEALTGADHLLAVSKFTARETQNLFDLKKPVRTIPNAVDVTRFRPINKKIIPNTVLFFGTIIRKKGVLELAEIFNQVISNNPSSKLIMVGKDVDDWQSGRSTKSLMEDTLSSDAKKNVVWKGALPYDKIMAEISEANVVVLPSFAEALPMTWLEAMAMEKALVTSDIGWAKEVMLDGQTGYTVNPRNRSRYSEKIIELLNDPELCQELGKAARKHVKAHFSTSVVVRQNLKFYREIIRRNREALNPKGR